MKSQLGKSFNALTLGALVLAALVLSGCTHVFHNGTEMAVGTVRLTGLPSTPYSTGTELVFSYDTGGGWIHDKADLFTGGDFTAAVDASGTWELNFGSPLIVKTATINFLLIDPGKNWPTHKVDKKHSGRSGGDVVIDNTWGGASSPVTIIGTVKGEDITWAIE